MPPSRVPAPVVGLREAGKADRLRRLKEATKAVLLAQGYENATTRQISLQAGVSIGTLFVYARDKRDLLFLVINDELDPVAARAHAGVSAEGTPLDRICRFLRSWYDYFAGSLAIGRCAFREDTYYQHHPEDVGEQAQRLRTRMRLQQERVCAILGEARDRGELAFAESPSLVGNVLYDIYLAELRAWVYGPAPQAEAGILILRTKLALLLDRLRPDRGR